MLEEAEYGKRKNILFPAFIEHVEYPYGFRSIQTADLVGWSGEPIHPGLDQILASLRLKLNDPDVDPGEKSNLNVSPAKTNTYAPGKTFRDKLKSGGEGPLMVVIPAGRFLMGSPEDEPERSPDESPQHEVHIAQPFTMGVHTITFDNYDGFALANEIKKPEDQGWGRDDRPVINVSWADAQAYCAWLCKQTGREYRLPSEAQWEYACRAGTQTPFYFGNTINTDQANFDGDYTYNGSTKGKMRGMTTPVGSFPPNAFGLHDMHGNVWEWCQDAWHDSYNNAPTDGSAWESAGSQGARVLRGGSWSNYPQFARAAYRSYNNPGYRYDGIGFRVCGVVPIE